MFARVRQLLLPLLVLVFSAAPNCESDRATPSRTELSIFAASSLIQAFEDLERKFETAHPDIDIKSTFAGSQVLRLQLEQGATVDVFASANEAHMRALSDASIVSESRTFVHNELVVIVPVSNPASIQSFADLPRATRVVIGTNNVPVGIYARQVFDRAKMQFGVEFSRQLHSHIVSQESNVRLVRAKVEFGEADAAVVYRSDAMSSDNVQVVRIPSALNVSASYPIALVSRSRHTLAARQFIDFVLSEAGQKTLANHGFVTTTR